MRREPIRTKTIVGVLADADPKFVSIVGQGANQRGFHSIKAHDKESTMADRSSALKAAAAAVALTRIAFDKSHFPDEEAVNTFLTSKGYKDYTIHLSQDGLSYFVDGEPEDVVEGEIRTVASSKEAGVVYSLGTRKAAADDAANDTGEAGAAEATGAAETTSDDAAQKAEEDQQSAVEDTPEGEDGADEGDEPDAAPGAQGEQPQTTPEDDAAAAVAAADGARKRHRPGTLRIDGESVTAFAARCEKAADEASTPTSKSLGARVADYTYTLPGIYVLIDALVDEISDLLYRGNASADNVGTALGEFSRAAMALFSAYDSIVSGGASAKSEGKSTDEVVKADVAKFIGKPDHAADKATDLSSALSPLVAAVESLTAEVRASAGKAGSAAEASQRLYDLLLVDDIENDMDGQTRMLPGRKSAQAPEVEAAHDNASKQIDPDDEERQEMLTRTAKRLGMA